MSAGMRYQPQGRIQLNQSIGWAKDISDIWLAANSGFTIKKGARVMRAGGGSSVTTVIEGVGVGGKFVRGDGVTVQSGWGFATNSNELLDNSDTTWLIFRRCRDTTVRSSYLHFGYDLGAGNRAFVGAPDGTSLVWDYGNATTGSGRLLSTGYTKDTNLETLVFVAGQTKGREIWRRGVKLASDPNAKAARSADSAPFGIGPIGNNTPNDDVENYMFIVVNRELSDSEIRRWCANPNSIVDEPERRRLVASSAPSGETINATPGAAAYAGQPATVAEHQIIAAGLGNVGTTGLPATVAERIAVNAATGALAYSGLPAAVVARTIIAASLGDAQFTGLAASLGGSTVIAASVGALAYSGLPAAVAEHQILNAGSGAAQYAGLPAAVVARTVIDAGLGGLAYTGQTAAIGGATVISATPGDAQYGGLPATVTTPQAIAASVGGVAYAGLPATITARTVIAAGVGAATFSGLLATVQSADRDLTAAEAFTYNGEPRVRWFDGEPRLRTL